MDKQKKSQVEDETIDEEEMESDLLSASEGETPGAADGVPTDFDDLIGEPESGELESPGQPGPDADAAGETGTADQEDPQTPPEGWLSIAIAPRSGTRVMLSDNGTFLIKAFFHRTRRFVKGTWRMNGKWRDAVTGKDMDTEPGFWRELKAGE